VDLTSVFLQGCRKFRGRMAPSTSTHMCEYFVSLLFLFAKPNNRFSTLAQVILSQGAKAVFQKITLPPLKSSEVEIEMKYNGLCHTDIHMRDNDWGITNYPLVAGHEGIGTIRHMGSDVKTHKVGDVVGVTWIRDSCRACDSCLCGRENTCRTGYQVSVQPRFIVF